MVGIITCMNDAQLGLLGLPKHPKSDKVMLAHILTSLNGGPRRSTLCE